jgi:hypothetical protein
MSSITGNVGRLLIDSNEQLVSLEGLEGVTSISDFLGIAGNEMLIDYCSLTSSLSNQIPDEFSLFNNAYNPTMQDIIDGNCSN